MLRADALRFPASFSVSLPDKTGGLYVSGESLEVVGHFEKTRDLYSIGYSFAPEHQIDLSNVLNREVQRRGGDGIVRLAISIEDCPLDYVPLLPFIPLWPGCAKVTVSGDVVRLKEDAGPDLRVGSIYPVGESEFPEDPKLKAWIGPSSRNELLLVRQCWLPMDGEDPNVYVKYTGPSFYGTSTNVVERDHINFRTRTIETHAYAHLDKSGANYICPDETVERLNQ